MATPAKRSLAPTPPDKGSFPLDHFGDCEQPQKEYLACIKSGKLKSEGCRDIMKAYLECRMSNGLMAQEDLNQLGFRQQPPPGATTAPTPTPTAGK